MIPVSRTCSQILTRLFPNRQKTATRKGEGQLGILLNSSPIASDCTQSRTRLRRREEPSLACASSPQILTALRNKKSPTQKGGAIFWRRREDLNLRRI